MANLPDIGTLYYLGKSNLISNVSKFIYQIYIKQDVGHRCVRARLAKRQTPKRRSDAHQSSQVVFY